MHRFAVSLTAIAAVLATLLPSTSATANPKINTQIFRPSSHPGDLFTVLSSGVPASKYWSVSGLLVYGKNPLVFIDKTGGVTTRDEVIQDQLTLDLTGSFSIAGWLDLGVGIPIHVINKGETGGFASRAGTPDGIDAGAISSTAFGDIRISPKLRIINRKEGEGGFGLAIDLLTVLPTGNSDSMVTDGFSFQPGLIADVLVGPVLIAANLGWRVRSKENVPFLEVDDEFYWRLGAGVRILGEDHAAIESHDVDLQAIAEMYGATSDFSERNNLGWEGIIGARVRLLNSGVNLNVGGGSGFAKGYGNTKVRFFAGLGYAPPLERDQDGDGILDNDDACPTVPEDFDNFEDQDGCPEPDNDQDGILDVNDQCPNDPEDPDGYEDADGCPDPDNDGDGILDVNDKCPLQPEDKDGWEDEDGCPDPDNDGDGILDLADKCPNEPETRNGYQDDDGCPDKYLVELKDNAIKLYEMVYFDTNKATIKEVSWPLLRAVASIMTQYPEIEKVRVEGHTDDVGSDKYNLKLSDRRAASVREFLIKEGIAAERMESQGFGEERPAVPGTTAEARATNRRVEIIVLKQRPIMRKIEK
ncbi:MAG: OmpA family protein [Myxococcota bacterium]